MRKMSILCDYCQKETKVPMVSFISPVSCMPGALILTIMGREKASGEHFDFCSTSCLMTWIDDRLPEPIT